MIMYVLVLSGLYGTSFCYFFIMLRNYANRQFIMVIHIFNELTSLYITCVFVVALKNVPL